MMESTTISFSTIFVGLLMITTILICSCCYCTDIWSTTRYDKSNVNIHDENGEEKNEDDKLKDVESPKKKGTSLLKSHSCCKHINPIIFQCSSTSLNGHTNKSNGLQNCIHNYKKMNDYIDEGGNMWKSNQEEVGKCNTTSTYYSNCSRNSHTIPSSIVTTPITNHPPSRSPSPTEISQKNILPAVILPISCLLQSHPPQNCHGIDCIYNTRDYIQLGKMKTDTDIGVSAV